MYCVLERWEGGRGGEEAMKNTGEISGSHGGEYEYDCLLGCCAVYSGKTRLILS
jgi:hypothetical protein